MKKTYVPVTLNAFLNESKTITLKRKYGERQPVVVGSNAPLRNQVLSFLSENNKVSKIKLKKFIAGLNESSKNPVAAANMWIKRNEKFLIKENRNGVTYYKLSGIGKRLAGNLTHTNQISESEELNIRRKLESKKPSILREARIPVGDELQNLTQNQVTKLGKGDEGYFTNPNNGTFSNRYRLDDGQIVEVDPDGSAYFITGEDIQGGGPVNYMTPAESQEEFNNLDPSQVTQINRGDDGYSDDQYTDVFNNRYRLDDGRIVEVSPNGSARIVNESHESENNNDDNYDFVDRKKGFNRPGLYDDVDEKCEVDEDEEDSLDESTKRKIKTLIENLKSKKSKKLNEDIFDDEKESKKSKDSDSDDVDFSFDELTFDDLDLEDEEKPEGAEGEDLENLDEVPEELPLDSEDDDKVEITEFVITVDDVDEATTELTELDVDVENALDEEGEPIENQIKVSAENWDSLKGWLEDKGVDIEEMFGGTIEVEDDDIDVEAIEGDIEDLDDLNKNDIDDDLDDLGAADDLEGGDDLDAADDLDDADDLDTEEEKEEKEEEE